MMELKHFYGWIIFILYVQSDNTSKTENFDPTYIPEINPAEDCYNFIKRELNTLTNEDD